MKKFRIPYTLTCFGLSSLALGITSCASSSPEPVVMPPSPPRETIQSTLFPATPTPLPPPKLPQGITLFLGEENVSYEELPRISPEDPSQTVIVQADPTTPFVQVEQVLERLHDLGYLIDFQPGPTQ